MNSDSSDLEISSRFRQFNWEKAKTFYYVAKLGSFTNAANFLHVTQPALSRHVLELEQTLGVPLFIRAARGVKLTRKGQELFRIIETMFLDMTNFTHNTHAETSQNKKRKIRIATTHAITAYILAPHIITYNKENPDLIFELISDDHMIDLAINDVDITIRPYDSETRGIHQELLFTAEKKLYASREYLEKYGEPQTLEDLKNHRIIAAAHTEELPYANVKWILNLGLPEGKIHEPVFTSTSIEPSIKAAQAGLGIIGSYERLEIIKNSGLQNILSHVKGEEIKDYFIYPQHLKNDKVIINLKDYLYNKLN